MQYFFRHVWLYSHSRSRFSVVNQATLGSHERRLAANESADVLLAALTANSARRLSYLSDPIMKLRYAASYII
jgi:hypothetical protein